MSNRLLIFLFTSFLGLNLQGQASYIKEFSEQLLTSLQSPAFAVLKNDDVLILDEGARDYRVFRYEGNDNIIGQRIAIDSIGGLSFLKLFKADVDSYFISFRIRGVSSSNFVGPGILMVNTVTNQTWAKTTSLSNHFGPLEFGFSNSSVYIEVQDTRPNRNDKNVMAIEKAERESGERIWGSKYFKKSDKYSGAFYSITGMEVLNNEQAIILFRRSLQDETNYGVLKIDSDGNIISNKILLNPEVSIPLELDYNIISSDNDGNILIIGRDAEKSEGVLIKMDSELNVLWAKRLSAENFPIDGLSAKIFPNGESIFAYYTFGDLPIIGGKLDENGNLLWNRGYSFFKPKIEVGNDSSLFFISPRKYFEDGSSEPATIFAKTDINGDFENCDQFQSCLSTFDLNLEFTEWEWETDTLARLEDLTISIEPISNTLTEHCGTPAPPTPYFVTPDTICQNQCLRPDSLYNHLAHAVEWTITGDDVLFENQDTSFNYCFDTPGKYQIEQEVWLLGCSDFFTQEVVVLPDSLGDLLGDDQLICDDTIAVLKPNAIRPLRDYLWSDSSRNSSLTVSESGIYGVEVSDGFCTASDEIEVRFFDDLFSGIDLELPNDTSICQELLPFTLTPKSDFSNDFFLNGSTNPQSNFEIETAGKYQVSTKIEGCEITKDFNLSLVPCEVDIYIPSSFSPNNDGINDLLEPLGNHFIGQKCKYSTDGVGCFLKRKKLLLHGMVVRLKKGFMS